MKSCSECIHYNICALWTTTDLIEDKAHLYCFGNCKSKEEFIGTELTKFCDELKDIIHKRDYIEGYAEIGLCEEIDDLLKRRLK